MNPPRPQYPPKTIELHRRRWRLLERCYEARPEAVPIELLCGSARSDPARDLDYLELAGLVRVVCSNRAHNVHITANGIDVIERVVEHHAVYPDLAVHMRHHEVDLCPNAPSQQQEKAVVDAALEAYGRHVQERIVEMSRRIQNLRAFMDAHC